MKRNNTIICLAAALLAVVLSACNDGRVLDVATTKAERNLLRDGNEKYEAKRYADAEALYRKALEANPASPISAFNLATALLRQGDNAKKERRDENDPMVQAQELLTGIAKQTNNNQLMSMSCYDLGNVAYNQQDYGQAIEMYKNALRANPDDDQARYNLRMAQLKQQQQQQNQDKQNQDQNQDQDKQDQDKQNQDKQDQDKQNQDKQNQDKQNQDQQNQNKQNQNQNQPNQGNNQRANQQNGMSDQNMQQILQTMQNQENATQQRVNAVKAREQQRQRERTRNKW